MSDPTIRRAVQDYLGLRRSFGYVLAGQDGPLADFAGYLERLGLDTVTVEAAVAWAVEPNATPLRHYQRLAMVRGFATYLQVIDPSGEVPPRDLLPEGRRRVRRTSTATTRSPSWSASAVPCAPPCGPRPSRRPSGC